MTKKTLLLWTPQHTCTEEQLEQLSKRYNYEEKLKIVSLDDVVGTRTADAIRSFNEAEPSAVSVLKGLVVTVAEAIYMKRIRFIVLPVGPPAFTGLLMTRLSKFGRTVTVCFAHSSRNTVEKDGIKTSVFAHEYFYDIVLGGR